MGLSLNELAVLGSRGPDRRRWVNPAGSGQAQEVIQKMLTLLVNVLVKKGIPSILTKARVNQPPPIPDRSHFLA
jgi:hypothetical protein